MDCLEKKKMRESHFPILLLLFVYHFIGVFLIQSSFVPDEYWQSLEVAHKLTFGYGYLTWEWQKCIRSCAYPLLISIIFQLLKFGHMDSVVMLTQVPRLFQAFLSAAGNFCTYNMTLKLYGYGAARWTLFSIMSSWFLFFCAPRTITNMAESAFTSCGLFLYPWITYKESRVKWSYLWFVGLSCMMRPTAVITWILLYMWHVWRDKGHRWFLIYKTVLVGFILLGVMMIMDFLCLGHWVLTPFQFFVFNWSKDIGTFYGSHPWHWYFTSGFPVIMTTHLIPFLLGLQLPKLRPMFVVIIFTLIVFSTFSHKEFRFLLPIMNLSMCICGSALNELSILGMKLWIFKITRRAVWVIAALILVVNIPLACYLGMFHQRGTIDAITYVANHVSEDAHILFLMPCHSTPFYSHVHKNISMKFLTCEPNFHNEYNYEDEADIFYNNPDRWLNTVYQNSENFCVKDECLMNIPSHIVMFDSLYASVSEFLSTHNYKICFSAFHAHFSSGRVGKYVHIYCKDKS